MSRTKKGSKGLGHEFWSKRNPNKGGMDPGPYSKKITHRAERRASKAIVSLGVPPDKKG